MATSVSKLELGGQNLQLLPEKALFWEEMSALILSDVHLGKSASFRYAGLPVPEGETAHDLQRLSELLERFSPSQLIIVGDLCHAPAARSPGLLEALLTWREHWPDQSITLVRGNHDKDRQLGEKLRFKSCESLSLGMLSFVHDPAEAESKTAVAAGETTICGHIHPQVALPGTRGRNLRAPCFWHRPKLGQLILPSFGSFTGGVEIRLTTGETAYAVAEGQIYAVPAVLWKS